MAKCKILVCDDEPHILHVVSTKLKNAGLGVITAADGEEAMALAKEHKPDLVITDYQMPYLSGLELCAQLREDRDTRAIPVIMLTARGFSLSRDEYRDTNVQLVLPKPFSPRELLRNVQEILGGVAPRTEAIGETS